VYDFVELDVILADVCVCVCVWVVIRALCVFHGPISMRSACMRWSVGRRKQEVKEEMTY